VENDEDYATDFEVVDDERALGGDEPSPMPGVIVPPAPVHPLSSLVTVAIDQVWGVGEMGATSTGVGITALPVLILTSAGFCFLVVGLIQRYVDGDAWRQALTKALAMGVLAGVPYQFVGTAAGAVLLGWAGIHTAETAVRRVLPSGSD